MVLGGAMPVGSSRIERLDPLALPVEFTTSDAGADGRLRQVELGRDQVVVRRAVRGIPMAVRVPVKAFLGVALRLIPSEAGSPELLEVSLEHSDRALSVPLFAAGDSNDIIAEWQLWARVLRRPLLLANLDGTLRDAFRRIGGVRAEDPTWRRRRRYAIKSRRAYFPLRRRPGNMTPAPAVYSDEREIIARN